MEQKQGRVKLEASMGLGDERQTTKLSMIR